MERLMKICAFSIILSAVGTAVSAVGTATLARSEYHRAQYQKVDILRRDGLSDDEIKKILGADISKYL